MKEMVKRGFSAHTVCISRHNMQPETHHCVTPHLRTKIENIVRKGGTPDPDAPQCLESIVYLCRKKKNVDESEKVSQTGEVKAGIKASAKAVAPLMHLSGMPAPTTSGNTDAVLQLAANALASGTKSALSGLEVEVPTASRVFVLG